MNKNISNDLSDFSVLGTSIEIVNSNGDIIIKKETQLHESFKENEEDIFIMICQYIQKLKKAKISIPRILYKNCEKEKIIFHCEYAGENIVNKVKRSQIHDTINNTNIFEQIFEMLTKIQKAKIYFDPHPKNYVLLDGNISYVDFTPPWVKKYFILRLSYANKKEKKILKDFFGCMHYKEIGYHLAADILKVDQNNYDVLSLLYSKMKEIKIINNNYDKFVERVESIINKEKVREVENLYLL